jgi:hypothetical protein
MPMPMLSDDDVNLRDLTDVELDAAWDLWFELAQSTNDDDPPHTHGVFLRARVEEMPETAPTTLEPSPER